MKKLTCLFALTVLLAGCGGGGSSEATAKKGEFTTEANDKGQAATVKVTVEGDKITDISIDESYEHEGKATTKKELKDEYGMKPASDIDKEWWEQAEFLENFIKEKGVDAVGELKDGYPTNEDVLAGCTMNIAAYVEATQEAVKAAK